ncbi:M24 family metallopeptidase [Dermatobacter hominis]|uniref:M24 family metallopeptidase n=1 Tax=Dermatobacter hominis TaxID=2884263 RepID=UPI001D0FD42C|nr:M24 family metallopeptidase [Dermatobacter hominis]UDY35055.1 M24 family metallopeptidase [Dermatobacter hominis]
MTVDGRELPDRPDLARMRAERHARLQDGLARTGLDGLLLLGTSAVAYATGAAAPGCDSGRAALLRPVALVVAGAPFPHLFTPYPDGAPPELPADHLHAAALPDLDDGADLLAAAVRRIVGPTPRLGCDEVPHPLRRALAGFDVRPAATVLGPAKLRKTVDEIACIREAQRINEAAMLGVEPMLRRPGVTQTDLTARFAHDVVELGAELVGIDPVWQVVPPVRADGPWTVHGDLAFPTPSAPVPFEQGDVVWVDSGVHVAGYASDFGRTWIAGPDPTPSPRQVDQFERWLAVCRAALASCRPGATAAEVARAAIDAEGGTRPWVEHFYLAHSVGTDSAEMPMIGTDLGEAFDAQQVLEPGMVLVFEPVIWDDGAAGYRAEDVVAITDDGWMPLSDHPYDPFVATSPMVAA